MRAYAKWGWIHRPTHPLGIALTLALLLLCVLAFLAVDRASHSVSDTLFGVFPFWAPPFLLHEWLAAHLRA